MDRRPPVGSVGLADRRALRCLFLAAAAGLFLVALAVGPSTSTLAASGTPHTYSTLFPNTQSPISEGGNWISGGVTGDGWHDVDTTPGQAFGTQTGNEPCCTDSIAALSGTWGSNQGVAAKIFAPTSLTQSYVEAEVHLHRTIVSGDTHGYEFNCSLVPNTPYVTIVRWPVGSSSQTPYNDFVNLANRTDISCANGDVIAATSVGGSLTMYKNGQAVLTANDSTFTDGSPGIGLFLDGPTGISKTFGLSAFAADDNGTLPALPSAAPTSTPTTTNTSTAPTATPTTPASTATPTATLPSSGRSRLPSAVGSRRSRPH